MKYESFEPSGSFFMPVKNVLSLFNGISALHLALDRAGIEVNTCYYAEIDKYANKITEHHYPDDVALGDVTRWREWDVDWSSIDLVGAGFPCQAWSVAGKQLGDKDERGMLFWTTLEIIAHVLKHNPSAKFLMENVKMKKDFEQYITHHTEQALGKVEKTLINSALVSAQNRQRYYWTNFEVTQPDDKGILLGGVLEDLPLNKRVPENVEFKQNYAQWDVNNKGNKSQDQRAFYIDGKHGTLPANGGGSKVKVCGGAIRGRYIVDGKRQDHKMKTAGLTEQRLEVRNDGKTNTLTTVQKDNVVVLQNESAAKGDKAYSLTASYGGAVAWNSCQKKQRTMIPVAESSEEHPNIYNGVLYRKLTPIECERLQTFPDNYTDCISNTQRYKSLGNAWTVDVIAHILQCGFKS
ncbi:MAG: DNA (cytosine-5-)-methyltransferase [Acinetobacter ursingii]